MNYYQHHIGDYAAATEHLSWDEDLIYRRLLTIYYRDEKPIPICEKNLTRLLRTETKLRAKKVNFVLQEFFELQKDGWHNKRADREIAEYHGFIAKQRASGKASAKARKKNHRSTSVQRSLNHRATKPQPTTPTPTPNYHTKEIRGRDPVDKPVDKFPELSNPMPSGEVANRISEITERMRIGKAS